MAKYFLTELWRYPVKALRGECFEQLELTPTGFSRDRHWMLVNRDGDFVSQRQQPRLALIAARIGDDGLYLSAAGYSDLKVPFASDEEASLSVHIWGDVCRAIPVNAVADAWLSDFLGLAVRLVYLPDRSVRAVDPAYAGPTDQVGFADGFPFLLISQASLDGLNSRLQTSVDMRRFRPNLVVGGCKPHEEDRWQRIRVGDVEFRVVKPCSRCIVPTVDPDTGEPAADREPIRTLMQYRKRDHKVYFGQNLLHDGLGRLQRGMPVEILEWADDGSAAGQ